MAIGAALLFNIKLPINFNSPYKALDIQDFWRRWHITLSRFLRDYIYIPLGGNRKGSLRTYTNLLATFIIGGIWHGAGWTFVFWGFLHGMALVIHRFWKSMGLTMPKIVAWFITFNFINIAWVFFRAKEWDDALKVLEGMFSLDNIVLPGFLVNKLSFLQNHGIHFGHSFSHLNAESYIVFWLLLGYIIVLGFKNSIQLLSEFKVNIYHTLFIVIALFISFFHIQRYSEFIYFNF
jgi:D-alanyl-lipoteichoic acid acyltransferase DltB (MBOAT superfamily)